MTAPDLQPGVRVLVNGRHHALRSRRGTVLADMLGYDKSTALYAVRVDGEEDALWLWYDEIEPLSAVELLAELCERGQRCFTPPADAPAGPSVHGSSSS
jgi:hypothetical protein